MKRMVLLGFAIVLAMNLAGPALSLAQGVPVPMPTPNPVPVPDQACTQVPELCLHQ
jgi:hypothetical protein